MTREEYDKIDALNFSRAKLLLRSPAHYAAYTIVVDDQEKFIVGTMVHAMLLEGKDLRSTYVIKPSTMTYRTNEGKAWRDAQTKPILTEADNERIPKMADAIACHPYASKQIKHCSDREYSIVENMFGVLCKSRLDMVGTDFDERIGFVDIKTCRDARRDLFAKRCTTEPFHYDMQHEWYSAMLCLDQDFSGERPWSSWIAVEDTPPFAVACYAPDETMIESGMSKMRDCFTTYKACRESGNWPAYHEGISLLGVPKWRMQQLVNE